MIENPLKPSDLLALAQTGLFPDEIALDTETSGLFADDGARTSTVSVSWIDTNGDWADFTDRLNYKYESINPMEDAPIVSVAWPFDQGIEGKPEDNGQGSLWPEAENLDSYEWRSLLDWLRTVGNIVYHNAPFDQEKMRVGVRRWPGVGAELAEHTVWDTQNVSNLLWPTLTEHDQHRPTSRLKTVTTVKFGQTVTDEQDIVKAYLKKKKLPTGRWDLIPWDVIYPYADQDARLTIRLKAWQVWEIEENGGGDWLGSPQDVYKAIERRLQAAVQVTYRMEKRGLPYDEVESRLAGEECGKRAAMLERTLPFEPATGPAAKDFFFKEGTSKRGIEHLDLPAYTLTEKNEPSLTAEVLARMVADNVPYAQQWAEYTKVQTARSMWYDGYADKMGQDGRLRCRFRVTGTTSSRFSVERVNLQAIPQDYRLSDHAILNGISTPRDLIALAVSKMEMGGVKWKMYDLDLQQAELRVAAMFAEADTMLQMIEDGVDLHTYTTKALFPDVDPDGALFKSKWRQVGKKGNFSLCFGSEWLTFMKMVSKDTGIQLSESESKRIVREWNKLYPPFRTTIDKHSSRVARRQAKYGDGWVEFLNKERRWFHKYEETHKAFNQRVQGNLAQYGIDWMQMTDAYLRDEGMDEYGAGLVLTVHDSQMLLLPDNEQGAAMAAQCARFGTNLWKQWFPGVSGGVDLK